MFAYRVEVESQRTESSRWLVAGEDVADAVRNALRRLEIRRVPGRLVAIECLGPLLGVAAAAAPAAGEEAPPKLARRPARSQPVPSRPPPPPPLPPPPPPAPLRKRRLVEFVPERPAVTLAAAQPAAPIPRPDSLPTPRPSTVAVPPAPLRGWRLAPLVEPAFQAVTRRGTWCTAVEIAAELGCSPRDAGMTITKLVEQDRVRRRKVAGRDTEYSAAALSLLDDADPSSATLG